MNRLLRLFGLCALLFALGGTNFAQTDGPKVSRINIQHVGPPATSDEIVRANIRVKVGDPYLPLAVDDDIRNLYGTGFFYNIRVARDRTDEGVVLTYIVQGKQRLTDIKLSGNKRMSESKIRKKITSKVGEPLDERKLFTDSQAIQELYQKTGYPGTIVRAVPNIVEESGRGTVTFEITEGLKVKIVRMEFHGAQAFPESKLREQFLGWWRRSFSWLVGLGKFQDEKFETGKETLTQFYREHGYIDFEIKDVQFENPTPRTMIIRFHLSEGQQYKVGKITFEGTTLLPTNAVSPGFKPGPVPKKRGPERTAWLQEAGLNRAFRMKEGDIFKVRDPAKGQDLARDIEAVEDFYGAKGHIDVAQGTGNLKVSRIANTETGTMDLQFHVNEDRPYKIEKIEIRGNTKTKDRVIRRELSVSPGEDFNMVAVKLSKRRLENMQFFEPGKVDARPEPMDPPVVGRKNLVIGVEERVSGTGTFTLGAGFSSVDSVVGFAELNQGNFDANGILDVLRLHSPKFTGAGQKFRLRVQLGTERQDYEMSFVEPWFLGRKLQLGIDLYHRELSFQSLENIYDEVRTGARFSISRALGSDFFIGSLSYGVENVGILLNSGFHDRRQFDSGLGGPAGGGVVIQPANVPQAILNETGYSLITKIGGGLAWDTRNNTYLPDRGQRTELSTELATSYLGGARDFYKVDLSSAWYFRGPFKGHVFELGGRTGVADGLEGDQVPFYERYYLGGLYSLRGFKYRAISPREPGFTEPIGGNTYWFGFAEYSIPIVEKERMAGVRLALFYDIGSVQADAYDYSFGNYSDNWGIGLRLTLPIGPLRLDYGVPIHHDKDNGGSGRFQFSVGWSRPF